MAQLLTATLDDVARKRGDLYPIAATLRANGAVANLTGATITVTIVDNVTRALVVLGGACTITDAVNGRVSYQPVFADMDREGTFDVEFKEVLGGVTFHFPCADYASLRLWPTLDLPPYIPPVAGFNDHSITLAMLAVGTPGGVLIYDAAGNPAVRANSGVVAGRVAVPVLISEVTLAAAASASATWVAGTYREIRVVSKTTGGMIISFPARITFNGDVGANYDTLSKYSQGSLAISANSSFGAAAGQLALTASVGTVPDLYLDVTIDPRKLTSGGRPFRCEFHAQGSAAATYIEGTSRGYWKDTTNDMTSVQVTYGSNATGTISFWGVPA
jgi:hypothetical protein